MFGTIQDAAIAALNLSAERVAQLTAVYYQRRGWVPRRLAALRWPVRTAQDTFSLWLGVPPGYRSQGFARLLLQEAHILAAPGAGFGEGSEGFVRISLTADDDALSNTLDRFARLAPSQSAAGRGEDTQPWPPGVTPPTSPSLTARFCPAGNPALFARTPSAPAQGGKRRQSPLG